MRTTVVPAQITTVEDKIAGNLGFSQLLLLTTPIFGGSVLFATLPPFFSYATYKAVLITILAAACCILAVRFKGKILLVWATVFLHYNSRPMYYVFSKNSLHNREVSRLVDPPNEVLTTEPQESKRKIVPQLSVADLLQTQDMLADPSANVHFTTTKKGGLRVHLTEVPHESLS